MKNWKKNSALFLISQGITLFGSSITQFTIIWFVSLTTASGLWVSLLTVSAYLPQFLISFISGVWADRFSKKKLIIIADSFIAVATLAFAILFPFIGNETAILGALIAVSVIRSIGTGIQTPSVSAAVPALVPQEALMKYNGINSTIQSIVQFAAPAVAGAVLSFTPLYACMYIDVGTAIVGILMLLFVVIPKGEMTREESMLKEIRLGIKYAIGERFIGQILLIFAVFIILCVPAGFMSALFVGRYYGNEYWYLSLVEIIGFIGMTVGGVIISASGGFKNRIITLTVGMLCFGALGIGMGIVDNFIVYLVLMAIYGIALTMVQTASTTLLQENSSPEMMGRVFGLFGAIYSSALPIGMLLFGVLADVVSLRLLMIVSSGLLLVLAVLILINKKIVANGKPKQTQATEGEQ